jgi:hypothetical protein
MTIVLKTGVPGLNRGAAKLKRGVIDRRRDGGGIVEAFDGDAFFFDSDFDDSTRSYGIGGPGHRIWATPAGHVPETW